MSGCWEGAWAAGMLWSVGVPSLARARGSWFPMQQAAWKNLSQRTLKMVLGSMYCPVLCAVRVGVWEESMLLLLEGGSGKDRSSGVRVGFPGFVLLRRRASWSRIGSSDARV